jgi:hypothetical protein
MSWRLCAVPRLPLTAFPVPRRLSLAQFCRPVVRERNRSARGGRDDLFQFR